MFKSEDWEAIFSVAVDGTNPILICNIPGHAADPVVAKEKSNSLIRIFEGTYKGSEAGTWNFIIQDAVVSGLQKSEGSQTGNYFYGLVDGNALTIDLFTATGIMNVDNVSGTWQGSTAGFKGTWEARRKL